MRRIIVLPYLRVMVIANIVIDSSSIVIANQIFTKDPYWRKLEMFRIGMGYIRYSSVLHWCLDEEKMQKEVVHSEPNLKGVTGPVVSSYTFSFWDFTIELTEPRTR